IVLYGREFWREVLNFDALLKHGMIGVEDLDLFEFADTPEDAMAILKPFLLENYLQPHQVRADEELPDIARSRI
ncbi:MAG: lysine decarboxylase, partial [Desulfovibrio sp.]|nr:lysine decarboxylase [Desulfovibrio sp.]